MINSYWRMLASDGHKLTHKAEFLRKALCQRAGFLLNLLYPVNFKFWRIVWAFLVAIKNIYFVLCCFTLCKVVWSLKPNLHFIHYCKNDLAIAILQCDTSDLQNQTIKAGFILLLPVTAGGCLHLSWLVTSWHSERCIEVRVESAPSQNTTRAVVSKNPQTCLVLH